MCVGECVCVAESLGCLCESFQLTRTLTSIFLLISLAAALKLLMFIFTLTLDTHCHTHTHTHIYSLTRSLVTLPAAAASSFGIQRGIKVRISLGFISFVSSFRFTHSPFIYAG